MSKTEQQIYDALNAVDTTDMPPDWKAYADCWKTDQRIGYVLYEVARYIDSLQAPVRFRAEAEYLFVSFPYGGESIGSNAVTIIPLWFSTKDMISLIDSAYRRGYVKASN